MASDRLRDKNVLITGAATGLGRSMALGLLEAGARVSIADVSAERLAAIAAETEKYGERAHIIAADLNDREAVTRLVDEALDHLGFINVLVNNAGISAGTVRTDFVGNPVRFWEHSEAHTRRFFEINAIAPYMMAIRLVGDMVDRGWGRIVNVTTSLDTMIRGGMAGYGGSKAALEAHTAVMAADLRDTGVTANIVVPGGPADTPMVPDGSGFDRASLIRPEAMIAPTVFLASDDSDGITGRRYPAVAWDASLPDAVAEQKAGAPIAWAALGQQSIHPPGDIAKT